MLARQTMLSFCAQKEREKSRPRAADMTSFNMTCSRSEKKKKGALHQQHNIGQIVKKGPNGDADCEDLKTFHSNKFFFSFHVLWGCSKCQLFRKWSPPLFGCVKWPSGRRTKKVMTHHFVLDFCNVLQDPTGHGLLEHEMESLFFLVLRFGRM